MFFVATPAISRVDLKGDMAAMSAEDKKALLKDLQVAFMDEWLRVRILNGTMLNNLSAIARTILAAA
jgi:hypothetical protein